MTFFKTTRHYACPECGELSPDSSHMEEGAHFSSRYCDNCGVAINGFIKEGLVFVEAVKGNRKFKTLVLLRHCLDPNKLDIQESDFSDTYIVVEGIHFAKAFDLSEANIQDAYFYDEHTCPTNYLGVEKVLVKSDSDPHGVFRHVQTILMPKDYDADDYSVEYYQRLFDRYPKEF